MYVTVWNVDCCYSGIELSAEHMRRLQLFEEYRE